MAHIDSTTLVTCLGGGGGAVTGRAARLLGGVSVRGISAITAGITELTSIGYK